MPWWWAPFVATERGRFALWGLLAPLYTRLRRGAALEHATRAAIHAHLRAQPGARFAELRRALALPNGVLVFHLRVLEREGYVRSRREWTHRRFWASGAVVLPEAPASPAEAVLALLEREPGLRQAEIARRLGIRRQLAHHHLAALERQALVEARREGGQVTYRRR